VNKNYTFNIIDTPGLSEIKKEGEIARTDEEITDVITTLMKMEITKVHVVLLFCSVQATIEPSDINAMKLLIKHFGTKIQMAVCITRAENYSHKKRKKIKEELYLHKDMKEILKSSQDFLFFIGAIDASMSLGEKIYKKMLKNTSKDRNKLLEFLMLCDTPMSVSDLDFVKGSVDNFIKNLNSNKLSLQHLILKDNLNDEDLSKFSIIEQYYLNHAYLIQNFEKSSFDFLKQYLETFDKIK